MAAPSAPVLRRVHRVASDRIELRGLRVTTIIGVLDHERVTPQDVECDIDLDVDITAAATSDDVNETTNYAVVLDAVTATLVDGAFFLLETAATRIAQRILEDHDGVRGVTVAVRKVVPPVPQRVTSVGVRTTLSRN